MCAVTTLVVLTGYLSVNKMDIGSRKIINLTDIRNITSTTENKEYGYISKTERRHIAFLKVHKAAGSTVQNILYRFGMSRNLAFVLPYKGHMISMNNAKVYNPILPPYDSITKRYDILCNHVMFNHTKFKQLLYNDSFYVGIVREPLDLFISSAYYFRYVFSYDYLKHINETSFIHDLISNPEELEPENIMGTRTFNYMAIDFGFVIKNVTDVMTMPESAVYSFVTSLTDIFDFVMVAEYFDESIIMLKRYLNWSTKNVIYMRKNEFKPSNDLSKTTVATVTEADKLLFKKRNRLDIAIYETFLKEFKKKMVKEKDIGGEVNAFRTILNGVKRFCSTPRQATDQFIEFPSTKWDLEFRLYDEDCELMERDEIPFWNHLVKIHQLRLNELQPHVKT